MRLLLINNLYPPYIVGGNEMLAHDVVTELRRRGHTVSIATGRGVRLPDGEAVHGILNLDLDRKEESFLGGREPTAGDLINWHLFNRRSYQAVRRLIRSTDPELVVVWNLYLASMSPLIAAQHSGRPVVVQVADKWLDYGLKHIGALVRPGRQSHQWLVRASQAFVQPILYWLGRPEHIVAISEFMRDYYVRQGFDAETLRAIHLGVPTDLFAFTPRANRTGPLRLLYVGSLWGGKGAHIAVRALGVLQRNGHTELTLDLYGDGTQEFKNWLLGVIAEEGLEQQVSLCGFATRDAVRAAMLSHDILVFPSLWDEPFAAVPVEAMSCGMAIAAAMAGGTAEAVVNEATGLLVPPNDVAAMAGALERLVTDPELRLRLGENAAQVARERFDFARYVDRLESYYAQLISNPRSA
ncbi:MAG: glycosyltransferase family 4 protein [Chloroflexi bacterium]|nr:glycosyltransferase family 4 protein [Chloroflexota bacterium]